MLRLGTKLLGVWLLCAALCAGQSGNMTLLGTSGGPAASGSAPTITQLCHNNANTGSSCTITASVASGAGLWYAVCQETGSAITPSITDWNSDTVTTDQQSFSSGDVLSCTIAHSTAGSAGTGGTSTITFNNNLWFYAYAISPFTGAESTSTLGCKFNTGSSVGSFSCTDSGTTTKAEDISISVGLGAAAGMTFSAPAGWTLAPGTNNISTDNKTVGVVYEVFTSSGATVSPSITLSTNAFGVFANQTYKSQ